MKMIKESSFLKGFIIVVLAISFLFNFADCKSSTSNIEITMWTFLNPAGTGGRNIALKKMINSFEEKTGIKIIVEPQQWDIMTAKFFAAHTSGNAPDIQWVIQEDFGEAIRLGALTPFEDLFLDSWSKEDIEDVDDTLWNFGVTDGKHYQVALSRNCFGIYYRADLFKEKGIKTPIETWDELIDAAQKLTEKDSRTGMDRWGLGMAFNLDKPDTEVMSASLLDLQGDYCTKDGKANWANDNGIKSLQLVVDMVRKYKITPEDCLMSTSDDLYQGFTAGKYAMIIAGAVRLAKVKGDVPFDPDFVQLMPTPSWDGKKGSPSALTGWSVGVWSGSKNKKEAGQFVEYMFNKESDKLWVLDGGQVPVRKSTLVENKEFFERPENSYLSVMAEIIDNGYLQPTEYPIRGLMYDFNKATQDVLIRGISIEGALKSAEDEFNKRNRE